MRKLSEIFGLGRREAQPRDAYVPPASPKHSVTPRDIKMSLPYAFDPDLRPAVVFTKDDPFRKNNVSLAKRYDVAGVVLAAIGLAGIRLNPIVILDGSGSLKSEYQNSNIWKLIERTLGFALQVSATGSVTVLVYGSEVSGPVIIDRSNYRDLGRLLKPDFSMTNMAAAFTAALELAKKSLIPSVVFNITDGNPYTGNGDDESRTTDAVIETASYPVWVKNLALKEVSYLDKIDDLPSRVEILKDANENPIDLRGYPIPAGSNIPLVLYRNDAEARRNGDMIPGTDTLVPGDGIRVLDNIDSQSVDPHNDSDQTFAEKMVNELRGWVVVAARVGLITGFPGIRAEFNLVA